MSDAKYCKDCKNINCPESRVNCKYPDAIACNLYRDAPPSIFDNITASPEALADKLVYSFPFVDREGQVIIAWYSSIENGRWFTKTEAIAATVDRLKEVYNE